MRLVPVAAALSLAAAPAVAAPALTDVYSSLFVFGDSLSDPGNLFAATTLTPFVVPSPVPGEDPLSLTLPATPPYSGRLSNGPVWAETFTNAFLAAGRLAVNAAFALANAAENGDPVPDFGAQAGLVLSTVPAALVGPRPLAMAWFGANDIFAAVDDIGTAAAAEAAGSQAAAAVGSQVARLALAGVEDFVLFSLPDLGRTPAYALIEPDLADEATAGTAAFNAALGQVGAAAQGAGLRVTTIDIAGLFDRLIADPAAFRLSDASTPCIAADALDVAVALASAGLPDVPVCSAAEAAQRVFFDSVHPSAGVHAAIAAEVGAAIAPIPLPASLPLALAGLGALALLRRRASA